MSTAVMRAGIAPDLRVEQRAAIRREIRTADRLEVEATRLREFADELAASVWSRAPRALSVDMLPTVQRLRLNAPPWLPKVPTVRPAVPAPVADPVAAFMHQVEVPEVSVWSRLCERAAGLVAAAIARAVVPRRVTASPAVQEVDRRQKLLAPLAQPGSRRQSRWTRFQVWADGWGEWLKPSTSTPYALRRAGS